MAGIYIHIPFCKQACHYCDFHFSTSLGMREVMLHCMLEEIRLRKNYLGEQRIETIYFGGGTPSLLHVDEIKRLLGAITDIWPIAPDAEITLEANPDDLTQSKVSELYRAGINRLSIGIQSFRPQDLKLMNRAHTAIQSEYAVKLAQDKGFENITIDLIYAIPTLDDDAWRRNLDLAFELNIQHISAYCLAIEPKTVFAHYEKTKQLIPVEQEVAKQQYLIMLTAMREHLFEQYEVSNYCLPGYESRHNSAYWSGAHYLGIGPSAHSYNGESRQWNVANNAKYCKQVPLGKEFCEFEKLSTTTKLNEYLLTGLRTKKGVDTIRLKDEFGLDISARYEAQIQQLIHQQRMMQKGTSLVLTPEGLLFADSIAGDFFET